MTEASGLTNKQLNEMACDYAISLYLKPDETKEIMLKKYNGSKAELVIFLHQREFAQYDKKHKKKKSVIKTEPDILDPKYDPTDDDIVITGKNKKVNKKSSTDQKQLF